MAEETNSTFPYPRRLRWRDRRRGRHDGRRRIPSLRDVLALRRAGFAVTSPYPEMLKAEMMRIADQFYRDFEQRSRRRRNAVEDADARIATTLEDIERCRAALATAEAPLTEQELQPRNPDEARWGPDAIRPRREIWRERRIIRAQHALAAKVDALKQLRAGRTAELHALDRELASFRDRAILLRNLYILRISNYWEGVLRTHVEGTYLAPHLTRPEIPLPPWAMPGMEKPLNEITADGEEPGIDDDDDEGHGAQR